ncbi:hypothetical protein H8356DRAFT_1017865 [Neocallimastix lanati (nom. inval.)]|uniref:Transmembrane protein n=1 Tax=Neocallimastix californiae TaxID=1754190 RepID=A0A1Y2EP88_9FUNG|nr:hypothetical protein H8356DRAFT_1017865 [Neocallimastix sp. JGI-2020a]ORY73016.1 hypothetical protein LY90DRAFT_503405 [Neocallimastix californiae]|eukprot:ORY73016.1 hypothetical protein LY90DRAFT_503405 [Neocallimastix californiae]
MGFWDILNDLSDSSQYPKKWNQFTNWIFLIQLIIAIGSCYINENMWPSKTVKQSISVLQIKAMLVIQIILFYWEITLTQLVSANFNIFEHHIIFIIHSAFLLYFPDTICGNTLLPYLFYSIIWAFGNGNTQIFIVMFVLECFLYIFQTLYAHILPKTLFIGFPLLALYQSFSSYKLYCWTFDGSFCPSEKIIYIFGTSSFSFIITYLIIVLVIYSITVLPFFTILQKLSEDQKLNISIEDSINNSINNTKRNSFKNK